uniref:Uncharacterized protein n=1 Tax=Anguilla anguilla TaxID=7936 RepID=A0A0E9VDP5_ANGAN
MTSFPHPNLCDYTTLLQSNISSKLKIGFICSLLLRCNHSVSCHFSTSTLIFSGFIMIAQSMLMSVTFKKSEQ